MTSSSSSLIDPDNVTVITISQNEFNQFHNIDRNLFTRIVISLGRDPVEAMRIVAYLVWLEKMCKDFRLVSKLLSWPNNLLNDLVNEAILALNCVESDQFANDVNIVDVLPLTQSVTQRTVTVRYLHENRVSIIRAVTKIINDVCLRAFIDIVQEIQLQKEKSLMNNTFGNIFGQVLYNNPPQVEGVALQHIGVSPSPAQNTSFNLGGFQKDMFKDNDGNDMLMNIEERRSNVPPDERTIFLTFSKGYPISNAEIRDYFSRRFGDIIEAVFMQEVQLMEQPLYARLVVRCNAMNLIDAFLEGTSKVKFSINGKHIWARKYVRKNTATSPNSPSPSGGFTSI